MNYIKEINAFYDHMERNPLSASAVTLWHTLMHINNKARWVESFTVAAPVIRLKSGLKESSFKRARTELKEKGYIDFRSRSRNQAPVYRIVRLAEEKEMSGATGYWSKERGLVDGQLSLSKGETDQGADVRVNYRMADGADEGAAHLLDQHANPLIKQKENNKKQDNTTTANGAITFYQDNFGIATPYVSRELLHWVNHSGEQLALHAMKRALDRGKTSWGYVRAILENWQENGVQSVEDARIEEMRFQKKRISRGKAWEDDRFRRESGSRGRGRMSGESAAGGEVVPEWFWERKMERDQVGEMDRKRDVGKGQEEIGRMLRELG